MKQTKDGVSFFNDDLDGYMRDGYVFSAGTDLITVSGTAETPFFLLKNPAGSGRAIKIYTISIGADSNASRSVFKFYINPTITTNGTALSPGNNNVGNANTSIATVFSQPTVSANGTFIAPFLLGSSQNTFVVRRAFIIQPNINLFATVQNTQNNTPVHLSVLWMEIPV